MSSRWLGLQCSVDVDARRDDEFCSTSERILNIGVAFGERHERFPDAAFLEQMSAAGYPHLTLHQAITMKAVGVTPEYAEAMNRAAGAAHAVEGMGELQ